MNVLLDIFHAAIPALGHGSLAELAEQAEAYWQAQATGVIFPAWGQRGPNFPSRLFQKPGLPVELSGTPVLESSVLDVADVARTSAREFWLSINPLLPFFGSDDALTKDFHGTSSPRCCILSPTTLKATRLLLTELAEQLRARGLRVHGVVLPVQDLWGIGAKAEQLSLTCFCRYCCDWLRKRKVNVDYLLTRKEIWSLVLGDSGTGIRHVSNLTPTTTAVDLVQLSRSQNFMAATELARFDRDESATNQAKTERLRELERDAGEVLAYMHAMNQMFVEVMGRYVKTFAEILAPSRVACVIGHDSYDWVTRAFFQTFDAPALREEALRHGIEWEVWYEHSNLNDLEITPHRYYLNRRARYLVDNFAETIDDSINPMISTNTPLSRERARLVLRQRRAQAEASRLTPLESKLLPESSIVLGAVAPILATEILEALCIWAFPDWSRPQPKDLNALLTLAEEVLRTEPPE